MAIEAVRSAASSSANSYATTEVRTSAPAVEPTQRVADTDSANTAASQDFSTALRNDAEDAAKGNKPSENTVKQAVSDINKKINPNTIAQYGYHDDTNRVTIKIVDKDSDKVIKEFPAEETLDMIAKVWELAGMFVDEKG